MSETTPIRSLVENYYGLIDSGRLEDAGQLMTEDVKFTFANAEPLVGRSAAEAAIQLVLDQCTAIKHSVVTWFERPASEGTTELFFEIRIKYDLNNGQVLDLPGAVAATINADGLFTEQRLYGDLNDVFAQ